jgi:CBS-domain-containing membrane protein
VTAASKTSEKTATADAAHEQPAATAVHTHTTKSEDEKTRVLMNWSLQWPFHNYRAMVAQSKTFRVVPKKWPVSRAFFGGVLAFIGLSIANLILTSGFPHLGLLSTSFGALATLVYAAPMSRYSRPRNVLGGNLTGAIVGYCFSFLINNADPLAVSNTFLPGAAVGITIMITSLIDCIHPPSGAVALFATLPTFDHSPYYILAPIMLGDTTILLVALIFNNVVKDNHFAYPFWKRRK